MWFLGGHCGLDLIDMWWCENGGGYLGMMHEWA